MNSGMSHPIKAPSVTDGLEQLILNEIVMRVRVHAPPKVLDWPCGDGTRSVEMAALGATVLAVDAAGQERVVAGRALASDVQGQISFLSCQRGVGNLPIDEGSQFDLAFCHYGLCFFPYAQARRVLESVLKSLRIGGKLYVSLHGLRSALGEGYRDYEKPVEQRYCELAPAVAACYEIHDKVCLYSERDLLRLLIELRGGVLRTFTATHGSVKGVAVRI